MTPAPDPTPDAAGLNIPHGHGELILLAEDQELMQLVTSRLLTRLGYQVLVAGSVEEAVMFWLDHKEEVELLLTDYIFHSHLTGMDLVLKLRKQAPTLPALIVSGSWVPDPKAGHPLPPRVAFLAKPYPLTELAATLRHLLENRPPKPPAKPPGKTA